MDKKPFTPANMRYCKGCIHKGMAHGGVPICDYLLHTGQRRGCPAGKGCIRKETKEDVEE